MKLNRYFLALMCGVFAFSACSDIDEQFPESGTLLSGQLQEVNTIAPERAKAAFTGMFTPIGTPALLFERGDDWGILTALFSADAEGADLCIPDSGYNWFSVCGELSSRNADYANPYIRYAHFYNEIARCNDFIVSFPPIDEITNEETRHMVAQAYALRGWCYLLLAPNFQFNYQIAADKPCVPIVTESTEDVTMNPRASVAEVYDQIMSDFNIALSNIEGYTRSTKMNIDANVVNGLLARACMDMGKYSEAAAYAAKAAEGYTPASIAEVSKPTFMDISEHNWIWGFDQTVDQAQRYQFATTSSWLRSFSANSYSAGVAAYSCINKMLYDKIPASDVRKGWWVDENLESPLLDGLTWGGQGDVANLVIDDEKMAFLPYTNVKFGCDPIGTNSNAEDFPLMRVEEMILLRAEALYKSGSQAEGIKVLQDFVRTYRDPEYVYADLNGSFENELWLQRRVELWGEGFFTSDRSRLNKPLVRFLGTDASTNWSPAFRFNLEANDGWLLMRFPQPEMNTNFALVDNTDGQAPVMDQNGSLRDGVTD